MANPNYDGTVTDDDGVVADDNDGDGDEGCSDNRGHKRGQDRPELLHSDPPDQSVTFLLACRIDTDLGDDD